ncbi:hypothetical protein [Erythrobacter sp.]|uniref:hypothetical protein n=1 Tax=Erythrobacter sp. TaxID=1042 RepID=UPI00311DC6CD
MAFTLGAIVGGTIAIYLLYALWEWALFKRVMNDPLAGKVASVASAYVTGSTLAGFGGADGGPYYWGAFADYLIPALIVGALAAKRGFDMRAEASASAE